MIPDEAVEAALSSIEHLPTVTNESRRKTVLVILEAAAPHIMPSTKSSQGIDGGAGMNARVEAAAKAAHKHDFGVAPSAKWEDSSEALRADYLTSATKALAAADAVMFSDDAVERAADALWGECFPANGRYDTEIQLDGVSAPAIARAVIAALKGDEE